MKSGTFKYYVHALFHIFTLFTFLFNADFFTIFSTFFLASFPFVFPYSFLLDFLFPVLSWKNSGSFVSLNLSNESLYS